MMLLPFPEHRGAELLVTLINETRRHKNDPHSAK